MNPPPLPVIALTAEAWGGTLRNAARMASLAWGALLAATLVAWASAAGWPGATAGWTLLGWLAGTLAHASARVAWARFIIAGDATPGPGALGGRELRSAALAVLAELCLLPAVALLFAAGGQAEGAGRAVMLALGLVAFLAGALAWARVRLAAAAVAMDVPFPLRAAWNASHGAGWRLLGLGLLCGLAPALLFLLLSLLAATMMAGVAVSGLAVAFALVALAAAQALWMMLDSASLAVGWRWCAGDAFRNIPDKSNV